MVRSSVNQNTRVQDMMRVQPLLDRLQCVTKQFGLLAVVPGPVVAAERMMVEGFRRLSRIADHKAGIRVRQVKSEEVDLALYAPEDADGFAARINLRVAAE